MLLLRALAHSLPGWRAGRHAKRMAGRSGLGRVEERQAPAGALGGVGQRPLHEAGAVQGGVPREVGVPEYVHVRPQRRQARRQGVASHGLGQVGVPQQALLRQQLLRVAPCRGIIRLLPPGHLCPRDVSAVLGYVRAMQSVAAGIICCKRNSVGKSCLLHHS